MKDMTPGAALNHLAEIVVKGWYTMLRCEMEHPYTIGIGKARDISTDIAKEMRSLEVLEELVRRERDEAKNDSSH